MLCAVIFSSASLQNTKRAKIADACHQDTVEMNQTIVTEFLLLGFQNLHINNIVLFILFLVIYILTLDWNLLIIILVSRVPSLKSPMYFFLTQLSVSDIFLTTTITPNMLHVIINGGSTIFVTGCITQFYFYCVFSAAECLLLTMMSYDRYLAICNPLHYSSIMHHRLCLQLVIWSWVLACIVAFILASLMFILEFCGPHIIDHYFCDLAPILKLSCTETTFVEIADVIFGIPYVLAPFLFILYTYISIFITIFGIPSTVSKQKAFSTCSSHLIVVSTYYGTMITIYMLPSKGQFNVNKVLSLLYTMGTPFFNPIIYSLRNQEIRKAVIKYASCSLN
ncbi:olfactory receptor 10A7-like [Pelodytes ibericus]